MCGAFQVIEEETKVWQVSLTSIDLQQIRCSCGHFFSVRVYESVNTQLSSEAVEEFLRGELNCPECPVCHERISLLFPVLFNDMERDFMVWVGNDDEPDGHVEQDGAVIYAHDYFAALEALVAFRADPSNATIPFREMTAAKTQSYVESYLRYYKEFLDAEETALIQ